MESPAASLPMDLLLIILGRVFIVDIIRCGAVCSYWRSAVALLRATSQDGVGPLKPQFPLLVLSDPHTPEHCYLYSFPDRKAFRRHLPQIAGHIFIRSSAGFLITAKIGGPINLSAVNPLTGSHIPLPPATNFTRTRRALYKSSVAANFIRTRRANCKGGFPPAARRSTYKGEGGFLRYDRMAAICPSSHAVAVTCQTRNYGWRLHLLFARPGDCSWTVADFLGFSLVSDLLFHKGKLFAVDIAGKLVSFNLDRPSNWPDFLTRLRVDGITTIHLAESPSRDDLLVILWHYSRTTEMSRPLTVYKLDYGSDSNLLDVTNSMGDLLLLCSYYYGTKAFSSSDFSATRFYYAKPEDVINDHAFCNSVVGVFDFGSGRDELLDLGIDIQPFYRRLPLWLSPVLF